MQTNEITSQDRSLMVFVEGEVGCSFARPESPRYPFPLTDAVKLLFEVLHHRVGDPELDGIGDQLLEAFTSYRDRNNFLNLPDRLEAFLKFTQRIIKPAKLSTKNNPERMFLPEVLQVLGLASASNAGSQELAKLEGNPRFAYHVERAIQARNNVHRAPTYTAGEKAAIFESVCVVMLFAVCELKEKLGLAMLVSSQRNLLERYRDNFDKWRERFVELEGQQQLTDEFEGIDPLAVEVFEDTNPEADEVSLTNAVDSEPDSNPPVQEQRRGFVRELVKSIPKLVLLGDPGAGKTTTLQYLAWHAANGLLKNPCGDWYFPVYIQLKTFSSVGSQTIEAAIQAETGNILLNQLIGQRCLFLLDGLNEVPQEHMTGAKQQIQSLLSLGGKIRVVMTCRPGQFQNVFGLPVFDLQPLKDEQIRYFFQKHLREEEKVHKLLAVVKRQPKLWEWARNPFMLAMLVRVFLKNGDIPGNRGMLMKAFLGDILKREKVQGAGQTSPAIKTTLLARLAFETRKLALLSFPRGDACILLRQRRDELGSNLDVPVFVEEILNNNLVTETLGGLLTFDHELYQEYFCAVALLEMGIKALDLIQELQNESRWEEPIIIYSGICANRSALLRLLSGTNIRLAAKALTSSALEEGRDREVILERAKSQAAQAVDPAQVAEALLSLAELGEAEEMITVLKQRGAEDATARLAIQSFISKCPADLVVDWMRRTSDLSDKFLISWMLAAIAPDQKEILLREHRVTLKELFLWQVMRKWSSNTSVENRHLNQLLKFVTPEFNSWMLRSIIKDILARVDNGAEHQWMAIKHLYQEGCEIDSALNHAALFTSAMHRCSTPSILVGVYIWSRFLLDRELSFINQTIPQERLIQTMRKLRKFKDNDCYRLSISLANVIRSGILGRIQENPRQIRTRTKRLERLASMQVGDIFNKCRVLSITEFGAFVELEESNDALLHSTDVSWNTSATGPFDLVVGQQVNVVVLEIDDAAGNVLAGIKQLDFHLAEISKVKYPAGSRISVRVLALSKEAATVELEPDIEGIIYRKELSWAGHTPTDFLSVGMQMDAIVKGYDDKKQRLILNSRDLQPDPWENVKASCPVDSIVQGKVVNIVDFGVFISIRDGLEGLLHINELTWEKIKHPSEIVTVGQIINVKIIDINLEKRRINLSLKQLIENPWEQIADRYAIGQKVKGKVVSLVPYGAFVRLEPGVQGLIHVTEMSWTNRVVKASDFLKLDQEIVSLVLGINHEEHKISLSIRQLENSPWESADAKYPINSKIKGKVRNFTSYGAFIELEPGIDGMIHMSDISWTLDVNHPSEVLKKGDEIEAVVLNVDYVNRRIALGVKQLGPDPWESIDQDYKVGKIVKVVICKIVSFGAFAELPNGICGLIHISKISEKPVDDIKNIFEIGQTMSVCILQIDHLTRKIQLSMLKTV